MSNFHENTVVDRPRGRPATRQAELAGLRPAVLSVEGAAKVLGISRPTLQLAIRNGQVRAVQIATLTRIPRSEVSRLLGNAMEEEMTVALPDDGDGE